MVHTSKPHSDLTHISSTYLLWYTPNLYWFYKWSSLPVQGTCLGHLMSLEKIKLLQQLVIAPDLWSPSSVGPSLLLSYPESSITTLLYLLADYGLLKLSDSFRLPYYLQNYLYLYLYFNPPLLTQNNGVSYVH